MLTPDRRHNLLVAEVGFLPPEQHRLRIDAELAHPGWVVKHRQPLILANTDLDADFKKILSAPADFIFMANAFHGIPTSRGWPKRPARPSNWAVASQSSTRHRRPREETRSSANRAPKTELRMSPEQTIAAVEAGGLQFVGLIDVPPYHYAALFERPSA